jgi:hypothetical protein
MGYTQEALNDKLLELYPEIQKNNINMSMHFDDERNSYVIEFEKGGHSRYAFLHKTEADQCMEGIMCLYLGTLVDQYVTDLEREIGVLPGRHGPMDTDSSMEQNPV